MSDSSFSPTVYALNVSDFKDKKLFDKAYCVLSQARKEKADRFRLDCDRRLSVGAGILLKYALQKLNINDFNVVLGQNGKPYLENSNIFFNLSHSKETVICAIAPFEIGCDIEFKDKQNTNIAKRFFTQKEYNDIVSSFDKTDKFYRYWTLKESFIKATGKGMHIPLDSFSIDLSGKEITAKQNFDSFKYYFLEICEFENYRCSVCAVKSLKGTAFYLKTVDEILSEVTV